MNRYKAGSISAVGSVDQGRVNSRVVKKAAPQEETSSLDIFIFSTLFIVLLVSYASLGKNIFLNASEVEVANDPISANIGYVRMLVSFTMLVYVAVRFGLYSILEGVPWSLAPFVAWATVSGTWADDAWTTYRNAFFLILIFFTLPVFLRYLGIVRMIGLLLHLIAVVLIASTLFALLVPSIGTHTDTTVWAAHAGRWRGIFGHKNGLGPWAAYGAILLTFYSWMARGPRVYWWIARVCAVACLLFSGSATSVVAAVFMVVSIAAFHLRRKISDGLIAVGCSVVIVVFVGSYVSLRPIIFELLGRDESFTGRTEVWALAADFIAQHPFLGSGYLTVGGPQFQASIFTLLQQEIPGAENAYLTAMLELGVTGLVLFFVPLLFGMARALSIWNEVGAKEKAALEVIVTVIAAALLMGFTESTPFICTGYDGILTFPAVFALTALSTYFPAHRRVGRVSYA